MEDSINKINFLTSTRWLSGPYRSLSNSITRDLKKEENFLFCLVASYLDTAVCRQDEIIIIIHIFTLYIIELVPVLSYNQSVM